MELVDLRVGGLEWDISIQFPGSRTGVLTGLSGGGLHATPSVSAVGGVGASSSPPTASLASGGPAAGSGVALLSVSSGWSFGPGLSQSGSAGGVGLGAGFGTDSALAGANTSPLYNRAGPAPGTYDATGRFVPVRDQDSGGLVGRAARLDDGTQPGDQLPGSAGTGAPEQGDERVGRSRRDDAAVAGKRLAPEAEAILRKLRTRDGKIKAHYSAQAAAGGAQSSVASYRYTMGPDGQRYATDGSISFQMDTQGSPQRTASQARAVRMAALAPANAGPQDIAVAAAAMRVELDARARVRSDLADEHAADVGRFEDHTAPDPVVSDLERQHAISNAAEDVGTTFAADLAADTFVNRPDYLDAAGAVRG